MALLVNTNLPGLNAQRHLGKSNTAIAKSLERLSSGLRINRAGDDAAGMAIANKLQFQVRGLNQAVRNVNDAVSMVQTAEGALNTITDILQRLRELAVQSASDTNTSSDRTTLKAESDQLVAELTRTANTSEFNGAVLLDGTYTSKVIHAGANSAQTISLSLGDARAKSIGSRAQATANISDTVVSGLNANIAEGGVTVAGVRAPATNSSDDQLSVLELGGAAVTYGGAASTFSMTINGTTITFTTSATLSTTANNFKTAVNDAAISNVTVRINDGNKIVLVASGGRDLRLNAETTVTKYSDLLSVLGFAAFSTLVGSATTLSIMTANGQSSAIAKGAAINAVKNSSGVSATAKANVATGSTAVVGFSMVSGDLYINGVDIGSATLASADSTGTLVTAINGQSSKTGVTASLSTSNYLVLTASDGRNITVTTSTSTVASNLGLSDTVNGMTYLYRSSVVMNAQENFVLGGTEFSDLGTVRDAGNNTVSSGGSVAKDSTNFSVSVLDISTQTGADAAILTLDAALTKVNQVRSDIGAIQSRLEMTINNLQIASENQSSAESRIRDADFAMETTAFSRNQILVQAGTSILAQANTLPQAALSLISGR